MNSSQETHVDQRTAKKEELERPNKNHRISSKSLDYFRFSLDRFFWVKNRQNEILFGCLLWTSVFPFYLIGGQIKNIHYVNVALLVNTNIYADK
jgi:hypothetical protein